MRTSTWYNDHIESITVEHEGNVAEFIRIDHERIGIRLNRELRYFRIRGISKNTIYVTNTGISALNGEVWHFVEHHSDDDAMWLAQSAFNFVKPIKKHIFDTYFLVQHPELAC